MTDFLDGVRNHYGATGLTERLKTALAPFGPESVSARAAATRRSRSVSHQGARGNR